MIVEIKIANYRSINQEQTLSFVAERATRHPDNLIPCRGFKLLKAVALFGANASGKSNLVKAITGISQFVRDSATRMNDGDPIPIAEPFRLSAETAVAPSRFEITFLTGGKRYTYGFAVTVERVAYEWLTAQLEAARTDVLQFERRFDPATGHYTYEFAAPMKELGDMLSARTRSNALLLSTGARENVELLLMPYRYLSRDIKTVDMSGTTTPLLLRTADSCRDSAERHRQIRALLRSADIDIEDFQIESEPDEEKAFPGTLHATRQGLDRRTRLLEGPKIVAYRRGAGREQVAFDLGAEESIGTQRLFALAGPFLAALEAGTFLVVDELDASMHPLLTRRLIELFQSATWNAKGAQLLFTTHDPALFDQELFRRDQIWLVEKRHGASELFSLLDVAPPPRNTEAFLRNYLAGRYGGTPQFGPRFEEIERAGTQ